MADTPDLANQLPQPAAANAAKDVSFATKLLSAVKTREQEFETGWWARATDASDLYASDTKSKAEEETPYNILYSNTEVLLPSLFSATPKPDVRARYTEQNSAIKPLAQVVERFLTVASDPASPGEDCFTDAMEDCVLSSLVSALGYVRLRYDETKAFPITYESGHFKTFIWGKASRWSKVPWIAFKYPMKRGQMFAQFNIPEDAKDDFIPSASAEDSDVDNTTVYEVWDKASNQVYFLCEEWREKLLQKTPDPLGLTNFYPTPGPLLMTAKPGKLQPVTLYNFYRNQAEELNRVTVRLNKILSAIKVRGVYNGLLGKDMENILSSDDTENALIPANEASLLAQSGGFDKHIWMLPLGELIEVSKQLYASREAIKQVIYEITGISDIIRGSSVASETATAQDLKNKWGTVRLRKMQTLVADYARDLFRLTIDCASDHVAPEKWIQIIQLPIPTAEQKQTAVAQLQYSTQFGQPPDPKLQAQATSPTIEDLLQQISSDQNRTFVINIQTSSTIDLDTAQDRSDVESFMNAMGQLLAGLQPLAALGPTGLEAAKAILMAVCQRYKFGIDIADIVQQIQAPPPAPPAQTGPPPPSPEEIQVIQQQNQLKLMEIQGKMQETQMKQAEIAAKHQLVLAQIEAEKTQLSHSIQTSQLNLEAQQVKLAHAKQAGASKNAAVSA